MAVPNPADNPGLVGDCEVLLDVLDVLLGVEDDPLVHWSADKPMDDWRGVRMSGSPKRVTRLELAYKGLNGTLPPEIAKLDALTRVDMRGSYLTGSIPSEWGGLTDLTYLHLPGNDLTGSIPPELGGLSSLERLYLYDNDLSGAIPPELGNLTSLQRLYLYDNDLTGAIPPELGGSDETGQVDARVRTGQRADGVRARVVGGHHER